MPAAYENCHRRKRSEGIGLAVRAVGSGHSAAPNKQGDLGRVPSTPCLTHSSAVKCRNVTNSSPQVSSSKVPILLHTYNLEDSQYTYENSTRNTVPLKDGAHSLQYSIIVFEKEVCPLCKIFPGFLSREKIPIRTFRLSFPQNKKNRIINEFATEAQRK